MCRLFLNNVDCCNSILRIRDTYYQARVLVQFMLYLGYGWRSNVLMECVAYNTVDYGR